MVSVTAALLTSVCGIVFIFLKKFRLVGGVNMGIAFFTAGLVLGVCAVMTVVHAKKRDIRRHMNWAIRTYSQILASPLYRYFYFVIGGLGGLERAAEESMKCDENDVCDYFLRTFDAIHAWTYFIFPLLFAELVVFALARQYKRQQQVEGASVEKTTATRSVEFSENVESGCGNDSMENEKCIEKKILKEQSGVANEAALSMDYLNLNVIGLVGAICCVGMTIFIYVTSALGVNAMSSV